MRNAILTVIAIVVAASAFGGQEYRSSVEPVTVPLTVTGRDRAPVSAPLTPSDFCVFEDGVEQQITLLDRTRRPVRSLGHSLGIPAARFSPPPVDRSKLTE